MSHTLVKLSFIDCQVSVIFVLKTFNTDVVVSIIVLNADIGVERFDKVFTIPPILLPLSIPPNIPETVLKKLLNNLPKGLNMGRIKL